MLLFMRDLAETTKLLSLNAAITASRADCRSAGRNDCGGSIATSAATWNKWVTSMSSAAPVAS